MNDSEMWAFYFALGVVALVALFVWALGRSSARREEGYQPRGEAANPSPPQGGDVTLPGPCDCAQCAPVSQCAGSVTTARSRISRSRTSRALTQGPETAPAGAANFPDDGRVISLECLRAPLVKAISGRIFSVEASRLSSGYIPVRQAAGVAMCLLARERVAQDVVIPPGEYTRKQFADEIERLLPGVRVIA